MGSSKWELIIIKQNKIQHGPRLCSNIGLPHTNTSDSSCVRSLLSFICTHDLLRTEHSRPALPPTARWINSALCWGPDPPAEPHPGHGGPPLPHKHYQIHQSGPQPKHSWTDSTASVLPLHLIRPLKNSRPSRSPERPRTSLRYVLFGFHNSRLTDCTKHCHHRERAKDCFTSVVCCTVVQSSNVVNWAQQKPRILLHSRWITNADSNDRKPLLCSHNNLCFQFKSSLSAMTDVAVFCRIY